MKRSCNIGPVVLLLSIIPAASNGQTKTDASQTADQSGWTLRDLDAPLSRQLGLPKWIGFGGQFRGRLEDDTALSFVPGASDTYYLQRFRFDMTISPSSWIRFKAQLEDARTYGYGSRALPANYSDPFDLKQVYVEVGSIEARGFGLKAGRQELILGSKRLIASLEWANTARSFDAIHGSYANSFFKADLVAAKPTQPDANRFDRDVPGEHTYIAYTTFAKILPGASVEPYYIFREQANMKDEKGRVGEASGNSGGVRVIGTAPGRFDYTAEVVRQWGRYSGDRLDAIGGDYVLGWRITGAKWKPRVSAQFDHASGDNKLKDGVRGTFDNIYGGHGSEGFADQVGWRNIRDGRAGFDFYPTRKFQLRFDFHEIYLASTQDGLYNVGGVLKVVNRNATSRHVGSEPDILATYIFSPRMQIQAGFSHIFAGDFLKQSTKGSGYSSPFLMWTKNF